jgi:hypothetical protein
LFATVRAQVDRYDELRTLKLLKHTHAELTKAKTKREGLMARKLAFCRQPDRASYSISVTGAVHGGFKA